MFSKILVIAFLRVGSVLMDANLQELCSRSYFDSFQVNFKSNDLSYDFQLRRRMDSNSYHSWSLQMKEKFDSDTGFFTALNTINASYELKVGQTTSGRLSQDFRTDCRIKVKSHYKYRIESGTVKQGSLYWYITDLKIINNEIEGPKLEYTQTSSRLMNDSESKIYEIRDENRKVSLSSPGIWLSGLFCRPIYSEEFSKDSIFVILEKTDSLNSSDRIQFVSRLKIETGPEINGTIYKHNHTIRPELNFLLESMDQTILDFLGIECPHLVPTETLFILMCVLFVIAIILVLLNVIVAHYRNKWIKFPTESVDGTDVTTYDSEASRRRNRFSSEEKMKALKLLGA